MKFETGSDSATSVGPAYRVSSLWLYLAGSALTLSGLLAFLLALARMPMFKWIVTDVMFFRRALIVHVNLALLVWVFAFIASLFALIPGRGQGNRSAPFLSAVGVLILSVVGLSVHSVPVLSNYVPVVDHPLFIVGVALFAAGILAALFDSRLFPLSKTNAALASYSVVPKGAAGFLRSSAIAFIVAVQITIFAFVVMPAGVSTESYFEMVFWGGGHAMIFAAEAGKLAAWIALVNDRTGRDPFATRKNWPLWLLSVILVLPLLVSLPSVLSLTPAENAYREYFTDLMRWGIFPVTTIVGLFLIYRMSQVKKALFEFSPVSMTFLFSILLTAAGFIFGALIREPNTMVPGHYHASIGAVTLAFMGMTPVLFKRFELKPFRYPKLLSWQPVLFGGGQFLFALGFAIAGAYGMGRKLYGSEQQVRGMADWIGLTLVGVGGLIAVIGGVIYMAYFTHCLTGSFRSIGASGREAKENNL